MKAVFFFVLTLLFAISLPLRAQNCGCDHTIGNLSSSNVNIINASSFNYQPGDVFCIDAGSSRGLRFVGFQGTAAQPLIFKNCGGVVDILETTYSGIAFLESQYLHLTGTGDSTLTYGFHVKQTGSGSMGVNIGGLSSDAEIDHIEIQDVGFAGIMAKTDPNCNDTMTWRRNGFVLRNLSIHHNYIHESEGEGMYIGYTGGYKVTSNKICGNEMVFGHWLENVEIYENRVVNAGWDGIQVNLSRQNTKIHDNYIENHGTAEATFQNFAMSIGGGIYEIYNNFMVQDTASTGHGMQLISAEGGTKVYNNVFINPDLHGIFMHNRDAFTDTTLGYFIVNNTVVNPEIAGFFYNATITQDPDTNRIGDKQENVPAYFVNNMVLTPGADYAAGPTWKGEQESFFDFIDPSTRDAQLPFIYNNIMSRQIDTLGLADTLNLNYAPAGPQSALYNTGANAATFGVTFDLENLPRPAAGAYDIGAYEYQPPLAVAPATSGTVLVYPNPAEEAIRIRKGESALLELALLDLSGKRLWQGAYRSGTRLSVAAYPAGVYFLRVGDDAGTETVKLVLN